MEQIYDLEAAHDGMGTRMCHRIFGRKASEALLAVKAEAIRLESLLSRFLPDSCIGRLNGSAGISSERVSNEAFAVLERSKAVSEASDGAFDATIGPLVDLWDYKHSTEPPEGARIRQVLPSVDYRSLHLDESQKTASLERKGQSVDLGGIGKGFASDSFMDVLRKHGITSAYSNIGGNVSTLGLKPDGSPWSVGIRHPRRDCLIGAVQVNGDAVVTSGDYERYFVDGSGRRRHHILDPRTGYPAESGLISVTVVGKSALTADALSTAIFVSGLEKGLEILSGFGNAQAILIDGNLKVYCTEGLRNRINVISDAVMAYV